MASGAGGITELFQLVRAKTPIPAEASLAEYTHAISVDDSLGCPPVKLRSWINDADRTSGIFAGLAFRVTAKVVRYCRGVAHVNSFSPDVCIYSR